MKKQFGIRMTGDTAAKVENFAEVHKMSPTAAAEFFVKLGIDSLQKDTNMEARMVAFEEKLSLIYGSLLKQTIYLTAVAQNDPAKRQAAEEQSAVAVSKIFGIK